MTPAMQHSTSKKVYGAIVAFVAWFAVLLQLYLSTGTVINFFSFFTILCNLLIAIGLTFSVFAAATKPGIFFSKLSVESAIALYIFIVGLVYNLVLRGLVVMTGWQFFVDNVLHVAVPVLYILYYLFFRSRGILKWQDGLNWIYFPLIYLIYSLIRGAHVHWYPYPFLNATQLGYGRVFLNIAMIIAVFLIAGFLLIAANRSVKEKI